MRNKKLFLLIIGFITTIFVASGFFDKTFACRGCSHPSNSHIPVSPPVFYFPPPPGFPQDWLIKDAVESIEEKGLIIENVKEVTEDDYRSLPANANKGIKFTMPSFEEDTEGCILSFKRKDNIEAVQNHFLELNEKGELYTWSFVKDNLLLVLSGTLPGLKARQYEQALYDLKE
jgi:hypothetical protein